MGTRRRGGVRALVALVALALAACGSGTGGTGGGKSPFEIPVIDSLTGSGAFLGKGEQRSLQILEKVVNSQGGINGQPVHFTFYDDQTNPAVSVQLTSQLQAKHVPILLGSTLVALCKAMAPLAASGPVEYCLSPGVHPAPGSYVFSASSSTDDLAAALVAYFKSQGMTKIALLTSTDASGQDAENAMKAALAKNLSVQLAANEHFNTSDVSVSAQVIRIKSSGAQALVAWSTGTPIGTVFKAITQVGLDIPIATTNGNQTYAQMQQYQAFLPKDLIIPTAEWPAYSVLPPGPVKDALRTFYDALQQEGIKPDLGYSISWDPGLIAVSALRKLGTGASAAQIRDYIARLNGFAGINGVYDFPASPQRGLTVSNTVVTRWDPGKQTWVVVYGPGVKS
jgi:branched-chain amino acid transport system substrate-binding protein